MAHAVKTCATRSCDLADLTLDELRTACGLDARGSLLEQDVFQVLTLEGSVNSRDHTGGTAPTQVLQAIKKYRQDLK